MALDGQNSKKPLSFVDHKDDLEAHQAFLRDLVGQGREAWNLWRNENSKIGLNFSSMEFPSETSFERFEFGDYVNFGEATFGDGVHFRKATFGIGAHFGFATFGQRADFTDATFGVNVNFGKATFGDGVHFILVTFGKWTNFREAMFGKRAYFNFSTFGDHADFREVAFGSIAKFTECTFAQRTHFELFNVEGNIDFGYSSFIGVPSFKMTSEDDKLKINILGMRVGKTFGDSSDVRKLQQLKGIADSTNAVNEARDLFILQRQAERKNAWKSWRETVFDRTKRTTPFPLPKSIMAGLFWILSDYGRSVVRPIAWLLLSIPLFYYLYLWLYPAKLKMVAQRDALLDYTLSSSVPFGRLLNPAFDRAFEWLFPESHHDIIGTVDITIGFQIASIAQGIVSVILLFLIGLSIRNYFKIS